MLKLVDIAVYFPEKIIKFSEIKTQNQEWDWNKIINTTGIESVHQAAKDEYALDMGKKAAEKLIKRNDLKNDDIDFLFWISLNNHYIIPSPGFVLAKQLGLSGKMGVFHNNLGCSGFVYTLMMAQGLFATNQAKRILIVTSTNVRKYLHPKSKGTFPLFGDAASAVLIEKDKHKKLLPFVYGSDSSNVSDIIIKDGAERHLYSSQSFNDKTDKFNSIFSDAKLYMNSVSTFNATLSKTEIMLKELREQNNVDFEKIDLFFFHQSSSLTLRILKKKFKIPEEKMIFSLSNHGNTIESAIPIALFDAEKQGKLKRGDKILLSVFGIGFSWISTVLEY